MKEREESAPDFDVWAAAQCINSNSQVDNESCEVNYPNKATTDANFRQFISEPAQKLLSYRDIFQKMFDVLLCLGSHENSM